MKKGYVLLTAILIIAAKLTAQPLPYEKRYTPINETVYDADHIVTKDSGFAMLFHTVNNTTYDEFIYLIKLSPGGQLQWLRKYGGHQVSIGTLVQSADSGFFWCTLLYDSTLTGYNVMKTDAQGNLQWSKRLDMPPGYDVSSIVQCVATPDGGFTIAGDILDQSIMVYYWHLFKVDAAGNLQWSQRPIEAPLKTFHIDLGLATNGDYLMLGTQVDANHVHAPLHARIDPNGNLIYAYGYMYPGTEVFPYSMDVTADGGMISVSWRQDTVTLYYAALLVKTDAAGAISWIREYKHINPVNALGSEDVEQAADGGYVFAGTMNMDGFFMKTDSLGNLLWSKLYSDVALKDIEMPPSGGISIYGHEYSSFTPTLILTNANGSNGCESTFQATETPLAFNPVADSTSTPLPLIPSPLTWTLPVPDLPVSVICPTTGTEEMYAQHSANVFPVPSSSTITIESTAPVRVAELMTVTGETVQTTFPGAARFDMDISTFAPGIYFLRLTTESGTFTRKVMSGN